MKLTKNSNLLLVGLALILSLVSFTRLYNNTLSEATKTALVISDPGIDTRFSIKYHNAVNTSITFTWYHSFSFTKFQSYYMLIDTTIFKNYTQQTLGLRAELIHSKHYNLSSHQTLYNNIA